MAARPISNEWERTAGQRSYAFIEWVMNIGCSLGATDRLFPSIRYFSDAYRFAIDYPAPVIAIDADINQHLSEALGLSERQARSLKPMGTEINLIKEYVRGCNPRIASRDVMIKTTPPGAGSRLITVTEQNPIYDYFALSFNGIRVMAAGPYAEDDLGIKCYHSKTGAVELFLNHLIDSEREYVVTDMTAG